MISSDLEAVLQQNLELRRELAVEVAKAVEPIGFSTKILNMKIGVFDWWGHYFGRADDQPLFFALLLVLIESLCTPSSSFTLHASGPRLVSPPLNGIGRCHVGFL